MAKLGWVGVGDIGLPMMKRLLDAGNEVSVWGRTQARLDQARSVGATIAASAAELGRTCEAVFLCVTDSDAVEEVVFGSDGIATASRPGTLVVDHSTIHPGRTRQMATRLRVEQKGRWVDAQLYEMGELRPGNVINGLAVIEAPSTTLFVPEHRRARIDETETIWLERRGK